MNQTVTDNLISIAQTYARATGLSIATVSKHFHGKQRFFEDLRTGKCTVSLVKLDSMLVEFGQRWPVGTKWPPTTPITMRRPRGGDKISGNPQK